MAISSTVMLICILLVLGSHNFWGWCSCRHLVIKFSDVNMIINPSAHENLTATHLTNSIMRCSVLRNVGNCRLFGIDVLSKWCEFMQTGKNYCGSLNNISYKLLSIHFSDSWLRYILWNCVHMNITGPYWWKISIGSGNDLVPSGNGLLPETLLGTISDAIWNSLATMC